MKKCASCGGMELFATYLSGYEYTGGGGMDTLACKTCGHINMFLSDAKIKAKTDADNVEKEIQKLLNEYENEKTKLQKELEELEAILNDENQTMKVVNEAKDKIKTIKARVQEGLRNEYRSKVTYLFGNTYNQDLHTLKLKYKNYRW